MARKAPAGGKARAKRRQPAGKKQTTRGGAAPRKKTGGQSSYEARLRKYQREHPDWKNDPHWKQHARGHKEREHVTRKSRFEERARAFFERQLARFPGEAFDIEEQMENLYALVRERGESVLRDMMNKIAGLEARYARQPMTGKRGRREGLGVDLGDVASEFGDIAREVFGYH